MTGHKELPRARDVIIVGVIIPGGDGALETCLETKNHGAQGRAC